MKKKDTIELSPSKLNLYFECPRCFWTQYHKLAKRPSGIPPVFQTTFDIIFKDYFDSYRKNGDLPKELVGRVEGKLLADQELLDKWRGSGLYFEDKKLNARLKGKLDDCLFTDGGYYLPMDYKTKGGFILKEDAHKFHQNQLDTYTLLLKENGYKTKNDAYLIFFNPKNMTAKGLASFTVTPKKIATNPNQAKKHFEEATKLLRGQIPKKHTECKYCQWAETIAELS